MWQYGTESFFFFRFVFIYKSRDAASKNMTLIGFSAFSAFSAENRILIRSLRVLRKPKTRIIGLYIGQCKKVLVSTAIGL